MNLKIPVFLLLIVFLTIVFVGCGDESGGYEEVTRSSFSYLDTEIQIMVHARDTEKGENAIDNAFEEIERLESILARHQADSDVNRINENAGVEEVEVNPETMELIEKAVDWGELTDGHFDVTVAPLLNRWGFGEDRLYELIGREDEEGEPEVDFEIPAEEEIEELLEYVDYQQIEINEDENTVFLPEENMQIEMAGIAKGYILEGALEVLIEEGIEYGFVRAGGDITTIGGKPDNEPWVIGIRNPREQGHYASYYLEDNSIGTAGDYVRYYELDGERYSHIVDPIEGRPARGVVSATVDAPTAMEIDVISTTSFVMGVEKGLEFIESLDDVEGALVDEEGTVHFSSGFEENMGDGPEQGAKIF
ncbi:FAD:protein FMN transferase [Natranaerofaba carboxydovora]|uniref:FAD:protein FMN transferase n=1 Tax=Natranaerofaba carboxydovora TaxID=2742683 RepID=UPI001F128DCC|nr:FAD:protein FMN transferase [Natranaerofaba carboxydovora]UMZ72861.1 FAD:protein FMN transferase [Natranaerofaba carboxydovora]